MKREPALFCPKCGKDFGRHRILPSGGSDFECDKCKTYLTMTIDSGNPKKVDLLFSDDKKDEKLFCPFCGPVRAGVYVIMGGQFNCTNKKCLRQFFTT